LPSSSLPFQSSSIRVDDLECVRGYQTLFSNLNFEVRSGQALQITGPNGCGKTSLLRILSGLTLAASGHVYWGREKIQKSGSEYRANLAYLGHRSGLKDDLTPQENLNALMHLGTDIPEDLTKEIRLGLDTLGISDRQTLPCRQLSAGQKQRIAVARIVLQSVPLWILDEPATSLDQPGIVLLCQLMRQHLERNGIIVFVSHQDFNLPAARYQLLNLGGIDG